MRIGVLAHNYPSNRGERKDAGAFVYDLAHELKGKGHEVFVFSPNFWGKKEKYKDVPVTWFAWSGGSRKLGNLPFWNPVSVFHFLSLIFSGSVEAGKFVTTNKLDVCLAMWAFPSGLFAMVAKMRCRIPYGIILLGSDVFVYSKIPLVGWLISIILKKADVLFGNSYRICDEAEKMSGKRCDFLALSTLLSFKNIKPYKFLPGVFNFLFVGRLEKVKGPDILVEAALEVARKVSDFRITMVGPGTMVSSLVEKVEECGLSGKIDFWGPLYDKKRLASLYLGADALVIPSRSESLPFVLVEAIQAGLPVVTTTVGDMGRVVWGGKIGFAVEPGDPAALAAAMVRAIREGKDFKSTRRKNLVRLQKRFAMEKSIENLLVRFR